MRSAAVVHEVLHWFIAGGVFSASVKSGNSGHRYMVSVDHDGVGRCTCRAWFHRRECSHIPVAVARYAADTGTPWSTRPVEVPQAPASDVFGRINRALAAESRRTR